MHWQACILLFAMTAAAILLFAMTAVGLTTGSCTADSFVWYVQ